MTKPTLRPRVPHFSSGPSAKRPGWNVDALAGALVGRSHRSAPGKARLRDVIDRSRQIASMPADWRLAIVPASDTGAVEMALWSLLGPRGVDVMAWESFGGGWVTDVIEELKLPGVRRLEADYGSLPDLASVDWNHDVVFTWNGTTSGVMVPDAEWIAADRQGLAICDATSAVFAVALPWQRLDVVTWSWQKVLGGEGAHGMLALGPRAVERLESYTPPWPMPKLFRMTKKGKVVESLFEGETINTPSMLCVEDAIDSLRWAESVGGGAGLLQRVDRNVGVISKWIDGVDWIDWLARDPRTRSRTSVCLGLTAPWFKALDAKGQAAAAKAITALVEKEGVGFDLGSYRDAPPGLRLWAGATVEASDLEALLPWLDWAHGEVAGVR